AARHAGGPGPAKRNTGVVRQRRRRRELFPPDRRLQARMALAAVLTPVVVVAAVAAALFVLPHRLALGLVLAIVFGVIVAIRASSEVGRSEPLLPDEAPEMHATVDRLCTLADLPRPELRLNRERQPNSWITDSPGKSPRLHVTTGLLDTLSGHEL